MKKAKRTKRLIAKAVAAVCAVVVVLGAGSAVVQHPAPAGDLEVATVERVVDGDTLKVDLNGSQERVRLIGVNAPESVHPDKTKNTQEGATGIGSREVDPFAGGHRLAAKGRFGCRSVR